MSFTSQTPQSPLRVAVLAGGRSSEHEVSLSSAAAVREGLLTAGHEVLWIEIGRDGTWRQDGEPLSLTPGEGFPGAQVVFPVLHGPFGEDGTVQGLLETLDAPYVGAGVAASALCLDKVLFKEVMSARRLPQVAYVGVTADRYRRDPDQVLAEIAAIGLPVFVKPAHLGSSVGIVKATESAAIADALVGAFEHDSLVIVEAMARGREVECGVIGTPEHERSPDGGRAVASQPGEIVFSGDFYDYEAKYSPGGMELLIPARIPESARSRVMELAVRTFELAGCEGLARVDFFVEGEDVLVNELNTMPGFTPTSVYAKLLAASGTDYPTLVDRLCRLALERHAQRHAYSY